MDQQAPTQQKRLMRWPEVERVTGISRATLTNMSARGDFPRPVQVSVHITAFLSNEVFEWLEGLEHRRVQYSPKRFKRAGNKGEQPCG
ncbi:helix-turn-helix transcriptional regulator [Halomonas sp.]|uniref:helix-turn-helix transcriptional regulator n=1 Tax=Halomonas sp. TaxID=1486246 RepID=UPI00298DBC75|nr:AlpA family phage regulatory protein [Halomonas sp.]MDW7746734.1 AlpA family phage regulatory protein [Halomonas sp.]